MKTNEEIFKNLIEEYSVKMMFLFLTNILHQTLLNINMDSSLPMSKELKR